MKTTPYELRHGTLKIQHGQAFFIECIPSKSVYSKKNLSGLPDHLSSQFNMAGEQKNKIIGNEPNQKSNCLISPPRKSVNYQDAESTPAASLLQKLGVDMI